MTMLTILGFLKALLPTKKIAAYLLGIIGAALALFMGVNNSELKTQFCANEVVTLPKVEAQAPPAAVYVAPVVIPQTKPAKK